MTRRELFARIAGVGAAFAAFPALLRQKVDEHVLDADTTLDGPLPSGTWTAHLFDERGRFLRTVGPVYGAKYVRVPVLIAGCRYQVTTFTLFAAQTGDRVGFYKYSDGPLASTLWKERG